MKHVALSEVKDDLSRYLRQAAKEEIVITRHGKAAGVLRELLDQREIGLSDLAFALRLRTEDELRRATDAWLQVTMIVARS